MVSAKDYATTKELDRVEESLIKRLDNIETNLDRRLDVAEEGLQELKKSHEKLASALDRIELRFAGMCDIIVKVWKPMLLIFVVMFALSTGNVETLKIIITMFTGG